MLKQLSRGTLVWLAGIASLTPLAAAGPLNPPPGPVASSMKTLEEIEPRIALNATNTPGDANSTYRITRPGSYYLTGVTEVTDDGVGGIEIASDFVTIDLMGHALRGRGSTHHGIFSDDSVSSVTIRNGMVTGFAAEGVRLPGSSGEGNHLVEDLHATSNGGAGISLGAGAMYGTALRPTTARPESASGLTRLWTIASAATTRAMAWSAGHGRL